MMFEQLHVFFSQISLFNSFFLNALCAQCLDCATPRARGSKLQISGELGCCSSQMPSMGCVWAAFLGHRACTALPFPSLSNLLRPAGAPKHANLKFALRKIEWWFFPWNELFLWTTSSLACEDICRNGMQKWYKCSQIEYIYRRKRLGFCRLVNLFGVRTVTLCRFTESCVTGP